MNKLGISVRMDNWMKDFIWNITFKVKVGSKSFDIINGIPQGSAISVILFNIMINDIFERTGTGMQSSM